MTWKDIYKKLCIYAIDDGSPLANDVKHVLENELKDKVIIQRGENRHPYADVLHEWVEDTTKEVEIATHHCNNIGRDEYIFDSVFRIPNNPLRIKPKEPIYEWQYCHDNGLGQAVVGAKWLTDDEYEKYVDDKDHCVKLLWTKRERKQ